MEYRDIIGKVAMDLGLPRALVDRAYRAYWRAVREHVCSLPLKEELTDEEFMRLRPNVNIPSIGKLYVTLERYRAVKRKFHRIQELKEKDNVTDKEDHTEVHSGDNDCRQV